MYQIDKLRIIESDAVPKEGAKIEALSTSIKITHTRCKVLHKHTAAGVSNLYRGTQSLNLCTLFGHSIALDDA